MSGSLTQIRGSKHKRPDDSRVIANYGAQRTDITDAKVTATVGAVVTDLFNKTSDREIQQYLAGDLNKKLQKDLNLSDSDM